MGELQDKNSIMNVLGCLLKQPILLSKRDQYYLDRDDFPERFHKIVFASIQNLYENGVEEINAWEIDGFLQNYDYQYKVFEDNDGIDYIETIEELAELDNFDYHYNNLKKYSLLRACSDNGIDISEIYDENILSPKEQEKQQEMLDEHSLEDIMNFFEKKFVDIKKTYKVNGDSRGIKASENIDDVIDGLKDTPALGYPLNSKLLNTIFRGARRKKYYIRSLPSGFGKSRLSLGDLLRVSVPSYYDKEKGWIENDFREKVLFISTELEFDEIQIPSIAYIADVEEDKIVNSKCTDEEWERVEKAKEIFKETEFWLEYLPDFTVEDVQNLIERHVIENEITYCVFDYIHNSVSLMASIANEAKSNLREDQILLLFSSKLKEMANKHDIFMMTGTQVNDNWKEEGGRDNSSVRGSRGIIDKADCGILGLPPTKKELEKVEPIWKKKFGKERVEPNLVMHVFKNRGNRYKDVKVFMHVNLGTLRTTDCFVTDKDCIPLQVEATEILKDLDIA